MLKLYGAQPSRASIVQWYLEELNVPYEFVLLDVKAGENLQPDYLAINPMEKVPAIVDGNLTLWESGAIVLYVARTYDPAYPQTIPEQAIIDQWVLFANSTLSQGVFFEANRDRELPRLMSPLNDRFSQQTFMLGDQFSAADIAVGSVLGYIPIMLKLDLSAYPAVLDYIQRISQRPAFQLAIAN